MHASINCIVFNSSQSVSRSVLLQLLEESCLQQTLRLVYAVSDRIACPAVTPCDGIGTDWQSVFAAVSAV